MRRAVVLGALDGWRDALPAAGVQLVDEGATGVDVVITDALSARRAVAIGPPMIVVEGAIRQRALRRGGYLVTPLMALPAVDVPDLVVPVERRAVVRHALRLRTSTAPWWKRAAVRLATVPGVGRVLLRRRVNAAVATRRAGVCVPLARAGAAVPSGAGWYAVVGTGDVLQRLAFVTFAPGEVEPAVVVKVGRVHDVAAAFDRDEQGLALAAAAGPAVAAHAPALLRRFTVDGAPASVESAAPGRRLSDELLARGSRARKVALVEGIVEWIIEMAAVTASVPDDAARERARLADAVLPAWGVTDGGAIVARVADVPAAVQHHDLGTWNVLTDGRDFVAVDWESARAGSLPLWDLFYFAADALAHIERETDGARRAAYALRLFRGDAVSSPLLFEWTRRAVDRLSLDPDAVAPLATLCWASHGRSHAARHDALRRVSTAHAAPEPPLAQLASGWLADPLLGAGWDRWRHG